MEWAQLIQNWILRATKNEIRATFRVIFCEKLLFFHYWATGVAHMCFCMCITHTRGVVQTRDTHKAPKMLLNFMIALGIKTINVTLNQIIIILRIVSSTEL